MKKLLATCAVAALAMSLQSAAFAQDSAAGASSGQHMAAEPASGASVYGQDGAVVGTIQSVKTDASGNQEVIVSVARFLGMGSREVAIPAGKLAARAGGGYTTSLSASEIKDLPKAETTPQ